MLQLSDQAVPIKLFTNNSKIAENDVEDNDVKVFKKNERKGAKALIILNKELAFQIKERGMQAAELAIANKELAFQNKEKEKRAKELILANKELAYQNGEKEKRSKELVIANKKLAYQNKEKGKRAAELIIANIELAYQNCEKGKRADELIIANKELAFQNKEKEKRAKELVIANKELLKIAFLQSHQVRVPIANILGLFDLFEFDNPSAPINGKILKRLKIVAGSLDGIITKIVKNTCGIKSMVK